MGHIERERNCSIWRRNVSKGNGSSVNTRSGWTVLKSHAILKSVSVRQLLVALMVSALVVDFAQIHEVLGGHDVRLWQLLVICVAMVLIGISRVYAPKWLAFPLVILVLHSLVISLLNRNLFLFSYIQISLFVVTIIILHSYIKYIKIENVIKVYIIAANIVCISIILEEVMYLLLPSIEYSYLYSILRFDGNAPGPLLRAHGFMAEPSQVSLVLGPALFIALCRNTKKQVLLIISSMILTFSMLTYLGAFLAFLLFWMLRKRFPIGRVALLALVFTAIGLFVSPFRDRIDWIRNIPSDIYGADTLVASDLYQEMGGTVGSIALASMAAVEGFSSNYFLGEGFGLFGRAGRKFIFHTRIKDYEKFLEDTELFVKFETGGSIVLRMIGEMGLTGVLILLVAAIKLVNSVLKARRLCKRDPRWGRSSEIQIFGMGIVLILTYIVRKDGYFNLYLLLPAVGAIVANKRLRGSFSRNYSPENI